MDYIKNVKQLFTETPPQWDKISCILNEQHFTKEELADIAIHIVNNCFCEYKEATEYRGLESVDIKTTNSYYLVESLKMLLQFGLDPNVSVHGDNAIWYTQYVDIPNVAASAMRLLLEHGGNPNITVDDDPERLFEDIDDKVFEDAYVYGFEYVVQCWLVLLAFGGQSKYNVNPIKMMDGYKIDIFKDFENYDYVFGSVYEEEDKRNRFAMLIFDKRTRMVVAHS